MTTAVLDRKTISITGKRQITIPQRFFEALGFGREAQCELRDGEIVLRPMRAQGDGEFDEYILADLIDEGYEGKRLLAVFKERRAQIRPAVEALLDASADAAAHPQNFDSFEDVFGDDGR